MNKEEELLHSIFGCKKRKRRSYPKRKKLLWERNPHCHWCGRLLSLDDSTLDHIVPRSRGGSNHRENLTLSCGPCNRRRGDLSPTTMQCKCGNMLPYALMSLGVDKCSACLGSTKCQCGKGIASRLAARGITKCWDCLKFCKCGYRIPNSHVLKGITKCRACQKADKKESRDGQKNVFQSVV